MKVQIKGEVIERQELEKGIILSVLHSNGQGKEVVKVYYGRANKKGEAKALPQIKVGEIYTGLVRNDEMMFPA